MLAAARKSEPAGRALHRAFWVKRGDDAGVPLDELGVHQLDLRAPHGTSGRLAVGRPLLKWSPLRLRLRLRLRRLLRLPDRRGLCRWRDVLQDRAETAGAGAHRGGGAAPYQPEFEEAVEY